MCVCIIGDMCVMGDVCDCVCVCVCDIVCMCIMGDMCVCIRSSEWCVFVYVSSTAWWSNNMMVN